MKNLQAKRHSIEDPNTTGQGFSVVICTYTEKRWEQMHAAINSARAQSMPAKEVIVFVDRNPSLYARPSVALSGARVVESSGTPGLSGAKNTGVALASGVRVYRFATMAMRLPGVYSSSRTDHLPVPDRLGVRELVVGR